MATPMLMLTTDVLVLVAEVVLRRGEALWLALTCRTFRLAMRNACDNLRLRMTTHASSAFVSYRRVVIAMEIAHFRALVHANVDASNVAARPGSVSRRWIWSPAGERALAAGARIDELPYLWHNWWKSTNSFNPGCLLAAASAAGRVDVLKAMDDEAMVSRRPRTDHRFTLPRMLNSVAWRSDHFGQIAYGIFLPALGASRFDAVHWYYERQEQYHAEMRQKSGVEHVSWRCSLWEEPQHVVNHAKVAATAVDPFSSLNFFLTWMWPRFGSRASRDSPTISIASAVLSEVVASRQPGVSRAWSWLEAVGRARQVTFADFPTLLREQSSLHLNGGVTTAAFDPRHVEAYQWISRRLWDESGWMRSGWLHVCNSPTNRASAVGEEGFSHRLRFALHTLRVVRLRRTSDFGWYCHSKAGNTDCGVMRQALADAIVWSWERAQHASGPEPNAEGENDNSHAWMSAFKDDTLAYAWHLLWWDVEAFVEVLCEVHRRKDEMTFAREYTLRGIDEIMIRWMSESPFSTTEGVRKLMRVGVDAHRVLQIECGGEKGMVAERG
jgi:hypothetical protein